MYILHDRLIDKYTAFSTLQALSDKSGIPYNTLINHFSRLKKDRYVTRDAEVVIRTDLVKKTRK